VYYTLKLICILFFSLVLLPNLAAQFSTKKSQNPIVGGWYADPEGVIFDDKFWVFPTYSAKYKHQVFMDAFSSKDMVTWERHLSVLNLMQKRFVYIPKPLFLLYIVANSL
jgi:hypothetical protein